MRTAGTPAQSIRVAADGTVTGLTFDTTYTLSLSAVDSLGVEAVFQLDVPARTLGELANALQGSSDAVCKRPVETLRHYGVAKLKLDRPRVGDLLRELENERTTLRARIAQALAWEPPGGLAPLLEDASELLGSGRFTLGSIETFLNSLVPYLQLEAAAALDSIVSATPYHDFLYGMGKTARGVCVMSLHDKEALYPFLQDFAMPGEAPMPGRQAYRYLFGRVDHAPLDKLSLQKPGETLAFAFIRAFVSDRRGRQRVLAQEPWALSRLPESHYLATLLHDPLRTTFQLGKPRPAGAVLEVWALCEDFRKTFRLQTVVAEHLAIPFCLHPRANPPDRDEFWLSFSVPASIVSTSLSQLPMSAELHLLPGEEPTYSSNDLKSVSLGSAAFLMRLRTSNR